MDDAFEILHEHIHGAEQAPSCIELSPWLYAKILEACQESLDEAEPEQGGPTFGGIPVYGDQALEGPDEQVQLGILFYSWDERVSYRELGSFQRLQYALTPQGGAVSPPGHISLGLGQQTTVPHSQIRKDSVTLILDRSDGAALKRRPSSES